MTFSFRRTRWDSMAGNGRIGLAPTSCQSRSPRSTRTQLVNGTLASISSLLIQGRLSQQTTSCSRETHHMPQDHGPETSRCTHSSHSSFYRLGASGQVGSYFTLFRIRLRHWYPCYSHIHPSNLFQGSKEARCGSVGIQIPGNCCVHRS